ncbi:DUF2804 domain-containing protein [Parashewanella curva]|uniref:DUF2804 domain-containing protein n=1 Tax=Parashewanella curva TaxID=2338552 RepID=A0A3L8PYK7_9GAMM|nr:DUF2804 domain-containing protein [Parashewanella curva]RLV59152.1 DUF2804 domain-containing protein [Parashewanella curva]
MPCRFSQLAPEHLIDIHGNPIYGQFDGMVEELNIRDFHYYNNMGRAVNPLSKYLHFKQFQFVSVHTPHFILSAAMSDIRYWGTGFVYLYDIHRNTLVEASWLKSPLFGYHFSHSPKHGESHIGTGAKQLAIAINDGVWQLKLECLKLKADLVLTQPSLSLPVALCTPTGYNGWTYTQKHNGLKPTGKLIINGESQPLSQALASYDFSAGFMRRESSWRWASINTRLNDDVIGLNLAAGVNETGSTENVLWVNGEKHLLPSIHFDFDRHIKRESWHLVSQKGDINLTFTPRSHRSEKRNLGWLQSNSKQFIGDFNGLITDSKGRKYHLNNVLGITEDHFSKW